MWKHWQKSNNLFRNILFCDHWVECTPWWHFLRCTYCFHSSSLCICQLQTCKCVFHIFHLDIFIVKVRLHKKMVQPVSLLVWTMALQCSPELKVFDPWITLLSDTFGLHEGYAGLSWKKTDTVSWLPPIPDRVASSWSKLAKTAVVKVSVSKWLGIGTWLLFFCCQSCHVCVIPPYFIIPYTLTKMIETLDESPAFACLMYCLCIDDMHWRSLVSIMDNIVECLEQCNHFTPSSQRYSLGSVVIWLCLTTRVIEIGMTINVLYVAGSLAYFILVKCCNL